MNIIWENLAEIRSLYVDEDHRQKGVGRELVEACISEAITLGLFKIFTLTYKKNFYQAGIQGNRPESSSGKIWFGLFPLLQVSGVL